MAKPLASLSSGLLARPGHAKPAMRPQAFSYAPTEDLGWNDMGSVPAPSSVAPPPPSVLPSAPEPVADPVAASVPPVLTERAELARAVAPKRAPAKATAPAPKKAAFTLRLDADRHLRLRLASAVAGRSSQRLLVAALDDFLNSQPEVEALARQVPAPNAKPLRGEK